MRPVSIVLTAWLALSLAACDEPLTAPSITVADLVTSSPWKLQSMERASAGLVRASDPDRFTLQFSEQRDVSVLADCNRCGGGYTMSSNTVSMPVLACTRAACPTTPFDTDYVSVLSGDSTAAIQNGTLQLSSARGTLRFAR